MRFQPGLVLYPLHVGACYSTKLHSIYLCFRPIGSNPKYFGGPLTQTGSREYVSLPQT